MYCYRAQKPILSKSFFIKQEGQTLYESPELKYLV